MKDVRILFIGNSHTYYNAMPAMVSDFFSAAGVRAHCVMSTEGGKGLDYHAPRRDVAFNILHGDYDFVVLQDKATHFDPEAFAEGGQKIMDDYISKTDSRAVLYLVWANRGKKEEQPPMTAAYRDFADKNGILLAPAGEVWQAMLRRRRPNAPALYREDGNHATPTGSYLAAATIFYTVTGRRRPLRIHDGDEPHTRLGIDTVTATDINSLACRLAQKYNRQSTDKSTT